MSYQGFGIEGRECDTASAILINQVGFDNTAGVESANSDATRPWNGYKTINLVLRQSLG